MLLTAWNRDFIIIDDYLGTIEYIGIKTTRIRSLGGEMLIFSNSDLTDSRLRNYKLMEKGRVVFKLGVIYQTPLEQLKEIPKTIFFITFSWPYRCCDYASLGMGKSSAILPYLQV